MSKTTNYTTPYANGSYSLNGEKRPQQKREAVLFTVNMK